MMSEPVPKWTSLPGSNGHLQLPVLMPAPYQFRLRGGSTPEGACHISLSHRHIAREKHHHTPTLKGGP